ncbi:hypothetical protein LIER_03807 [Lithospermum erythrorhizon]|uniref:Uncharacterized protein n=1 Tax=Lithospermum erythrorhizon TaxID=34254 RepID=A0AAV3NUI9_LITER
MLECRLFHVHDAFDLSGTSSGVEVGKYFDFRVVHMGMVRSEFKSLTSIFFFRLEEVIKMVHETSVSGSVIGNERIVLHKGGHDQTSEWEVLDMLKRGMKRPTHNFPWLDQASQR